MKKYDYMEAMIEDIRNYINENIDAEAVEDLDELEEQLNEDLWTVDSVTGNGSGSYTFDSAQARECVLENIDLLREAYDEFDTDAAAIGKQFLNEDWEAMDVTIRCYLLRRAISEALADFAFDVPLF